MESLKCVEIHTVVLDACVKLDSHVIGGDSVEVLMTLEHG